MRDEGGQMLAILALALIMIVGFAALAIDLGNVGQSSRHSQNAVDLAVLSGAQILGTDQCAGCTGGADPSKVPNDFTAMVTAIEGYLTTNYTGVDANGWDTCPGVAASGESIAWLASYPNDSNGAQNCITFGTSPGSSQYNVVRVQLPPQLIRYFLGQAVGAGQGQNVSSVAYASVQTAAVFQGLPIGIGTDSAGSGYTCLKGGNGKASCTNGLPPSAQGIVVNPRYRVYTKAPDNGGGNNDAVELDLALGLDHGLQAYDNSAANHYCDAKDSPATSQCPNADINNSTSSAYWDLSSLIYLASGNTNNTVQNGLVCGDNSVDAPDSVGTMQARLAHNATDATFNTTVANPGESAASPTISASLFCNSPITNNIDGRQISCYLTSSCTAPGGNVSPTGGGTTLYNYAYGPASTCVTSSPNPSTTDVQNAVWTNGASCLASKLVADSTSAWSAVQAGSTPAPDFPQSITSSPRFALVPVVPKNCTGMCKIQKDPPFAPYGFAAAYLDEGFLQGNDFSIEAFVFSPFLVQGGPFIGGGAGTGKYNGGPFVVNLCSPTGGGNVGNC